MEHVSDDLKLVDPSVEDIHEIEADVELGAENETGRGAAVAVDDEGVHKDPDHPGLVLVEFELAEYFGGQFEHAAAEVVDAQTVDSGVVVDDGVVFEGWDLLESFASVESVEEIQRAFAEADQVSGY